MSDPNMPLNKKDKKRIELNRGQGNLQSYEPFIQVGEFSSSGESIRVKSSTVGRLHHFHSGIELAAFLIFDRHPNCIDIREQFPIPLADSLVICEQLGIKHPSVKGELIILTTDLVIDLQAGKSLAIAVKPSQELNKKRVLEKLQIEKAFWENQDTEWFIFTDKERPVELSTNLKWMRSFLDADTKETYEISDNDVSNLIERLSKSEKGKVTKRCAELDDEYELEPGTHVEIFRYSIAKSFIQADLRIKYFEWRIQDLIFNSFEQVKGRLTNVS